MLAQLAQLALVMLQVIWCADVEAAMAAPSPLVMLHALFQRWGWDKKTYAV